MPKKKSRPYFSLGPTEPIPIEEIAKRPFLTLVEAGRLVRISAWTIRKYIIEGKLRRYRIGKRVVIARQDLIDFMESHAGRDDKGPWPSLRTTPPR